MSFLDIERGSKIDHRVSTGAIVNGAVTPPKLDRAYPQVVGGTISGGTIDGSYAYNFSSSSGTFAGIATQHVLKAGDTMTGDLHIDKDDPIIWFQKNGITAAKIFGRYTPGTPDYTMILIEPMAPSSDAETEIRFFRETNTTGPRRFLIYKGDGTSSVTFKIDASTGNITKMGWAEIGSTNDAAAANSSLYFSTDQNKLCWKDDAGTIHPLY